MNTSVITAGFTWCKVNSVWASAMNEKKKILKQVPPFSDCRTHYALNGSLGTCRKIMWWKLFHFYLVSSHTMDYCLCPVVLMSMVSQSLEELGMNLVRVLSLN